MRRPPSGAAAPHAAAHSRRDQRAPGMSLLPPDVLLLLFPEATLPRQARAVRHSVRVRVLPPEVPDQELADDAQEPAAPRLERHAEAAAEDVGAAERAGAGAAPPVRPRRRPPAAAARPAMTSAHGLNARPAGRPGPRPRALLHLTQSHQGQPQVQYNGQCQNNAGLCRIINRIIIS